MVRVALLMSALLAHVSAYIYERCELARELTSLGVHRDHLATWVCIAYHESRFDTAARNHGSGDHGLFQISELYWCGPGKACGAPCTAFRDEDISDDLECALKIHKEHTRLQGDGYLAWVVYPQHCKHINAKKYLVDCEASIKNVTVKTEPRSRSLKNNFNTTPKPFDANYYAKSLPSFLAINSLFEGNQAKQFEGDGEEIDWVNFKLDNIDDIKLPVVSKDVLIKSVTPATITTTTVNNFEENYLRKSLKNDWFNVKFDNIDSLKLPTFNKNTGNQHNNYNIGLPSWLNIKIDSKIDDLTLPVQNNDIVNRYVTPSTTTTTVNNYEENYLRKSYKNDWFNFKIDNIDDIKLPAVYKSDGYQRNNYKSEPFNWLNIKIDSRIDDLDLPVFNKQADIENTTPTFIKKTTTMRTTTIDPDLIGIKPPMPKKIESNQFRRTMMMIKAMLAIQDAKNNNLPDETVVQPDSNINNTPDRATTKIQLQTTTTPEPVPSAPSYSAHNNNNRITSTPLPKKSVFSFRWNSTLRPSFFTKEVTTQKSISSEENTTPSTILSQNQYKGSVTEANQFLDESHVTKANSELTTQSAYTVSKLINKNDESVDVINDTLILKPDTVVTTTPLPSYFNKYFQEQSTTSTTTAKPTTNSWNYYKQTTSKSETTTVSSKGKFSFNWNKSFQERFTFKPFTLSTQQSTTSRPYGTYNSATLKPATTNTSKIFSFVYNPFENLLNVSKATLPPASSTKKPYWSGITTQSTYNTSTSKPSLTDSSNKTSSTISNRNKPLFSTSVASNKSKDIQENALKFTPITVSPTTKKHGWSFNSFNSDFNRPSEKRFNAIQSVAPHTVVTSTSRPFWTYKPTVKTEVLNISSEPNKFSSLESFTTKPVQDFSNTVNVVPGTVKSSKDNPSTSVKPQVEVKPSEKPPEQATAKSTPSIFDLYLRPNKFSTAQQFQFPSPKSSGNKLTIFSGGTTPPPASFLSSKL